MNKAIFLDRDGTINFDKAYMSKIEDFEYIPGAVEGLKMLQKAGYLLIVVTNQSGIARGYYTEQDFLKLNAWMLDDLKKKGINISKVCYCPHHPCGKVNEYRLNCKCRKPKLGMYEEAIQEFDIDVERSYTIGDRMRDFSLCEKYNCHGYLISDLERSDIVNDVEFGKYWNIKYADDLLTAAKEILGGK